jgi:hypothetical protein
MAKQFGVECHAVNRYLADKNQTRRRIAESVGIEVDQAKVCLLALMYGARLSLRPDNAIPEAIGVEKARRLYADPTFAAIAKDLREAGRRS